MMRKKEKQHSLSVWFLTSSPAVANSSATLPQEEVMVMCVIALPERSAGPVWTFSRHTGTAVGSLVAPNASYCYCWRWVVSATPACFPMDVSGIEGSTLLWRNNSNKKKKDKQKSCDTFREEPRVNESNVYSYQTYSIELFPFCMIFSIVSLSEADLTETSISLGVQTKAGMEGFLVWIHDSWWRWRSVYYKAESRGPLSYPRSPTPHPTPPQHCTSCHRRPNLMISVQGHKHVLLPHRLLIIVSG